MFHEIVGLEVVVLTARGSFSRRHVSGWILPDRGLVFTLQTHKVRVSGLTLRSMYFLANMPVLKVAALASG